MTPQYEALVRELYDAWNRRDEATMLAHATPEFEYVNAPEAVEPGARRGPEGLATVVRKQWEGLGSDARQEIDMVHTRGDTVIVESRLTRTMPGSTAQIDNRVATRWTFRERRIVRIEVLGAGSQFRAGLESAGVKDERSA